LGVVCVVAAKVPRLRRLERIELLDRAAQSATDGQWQGGVPPLQISHTDGASEPMEARRTPEWIRIFAFCAEIAVHWLRCEHGHPLFEALPRMPSSTVQNRKEVNREIAARTARAGGASSNGAGPDARISDYFGINTLGARQMRDKL